MLVRKTKPLAIECVVRGYVSGSGWKDYHVYRKNLRHPASIGPARIGPNCPSPFSRPPRKPPPATTKIFRSTKPPTLVGKDLAERVRASQPGNLQSGFRLTPRRAASFSPTPNSNSACSAIELIWIDEALTPDSSRFWPAAQYQPGGPQASFDKQFVRDYLERIRWPKTPPGPELPPDVVAATRAKYREAYRILVGRELD